MSLLLTFDQSDVNRVRVHCTAQWNLATDETYILQCNEIFDNSSDNHLSVPSPRHSLCVQRHYFSIRVNNKRTCRSRRLRHWTLSATSRGRGASAAEVNARFGDPTPGGAGVSGGDSATINRSNASMRRLSGIVPIEPGAIELSADQPACSWRLCSRCSDCQRYDWWDDASIHKMFARRSVSQSVCLYVCLSVCSSVRLARCRARACSAIYMYTRAIGNRDWRCRGSADCFLAYRCIVGSSLASVGRVQCTADNNTEVEQVRGPTVLYRL